MKAKIPKLMEGYRRQWYKCKKRGCGQAFYKDYIPFGLSSPIIITPCGHSIGYRDYNMKPITKKEALRLMRSK